MLIIGLVGAALLYGVLYWLYLLADAQLLGATSTLAFINKMLFMPEPNVFFLLRSLILITFFYVIADALMSPARKGMRSMKQRRAEARYNQTVFRGAKPVVAPPPDDDFATHY